METSNTNPQKVSTYDPGEEMFSWIAHDYHPHERGIVWMVIFCSILTGMAFLAIYTDPKWGWVTAVTLFLAAAVYFWVHRNGNESHEIRCFHRGLLIDSTQYIKWTDFEGFWFVYDETVSVINFEYRRSTNKNITLQMSDNDPDFFRQNLEKIAVNELTEKRESTLDLWIRVLKL